LKKLLGVFLCVCLILSFTVSAFALPAEQGQTPFVLVSGMGYKPLVYNLGQEGEKNVFPPDIEAKQIILPLFFGIFSAVSGQGLHGFTKHVTKAADNILRLAACDENGNSKYNVSPITYPKSLDNYPEFSQANQSEGGLLRSACDKIGAENVYYFNYDWRLSPIDNAALLHDFIEGVKLEKSCDKVDLAALSMGGIVTLTYFRIYGSDSVKSCLMLGSTYAGSDLAGGALMGRLGINKASLLNYLPQNFGGEDLKLFLRSFFFVLDFLGIADPVVKGLNTLIDALIFDLEESGFLRDNFFTMPGLWATVRQEDYEDAKALHLDKDNHAKLIEKIDFVQYEVHQKRKALIESAKANGVKVYFVANYNLAPPPISPEAAVHSDATIETVYAGGGATLAPLGQVLPADYKQKNVCQGHNHLSSDRIIDASTADFPDLVWFVKNVWHVRCFYGSEYNEFLLWLIHSPEQVTVFDSDDYPQFLVSFDDGMTIAPLI